MNAAHDETWTELAEKKAAILQRQVAAVMAWAGDDTELAAQLAEPYFELLQEIYSEELPLAKAIDTSDFVVRLDGEAVAGRDPRISLIADFFVNVRRRVGSVAYAISGVVTEKSVLPKDVDLSLTAYATGSLYLGFSLPDPESVNEKGEKNVLGAEDPLYVATKRAIRTLGIVSQSLEEKQPPAEIAERIPDPRVRDTALVAIQNLAPSGKKGIHSVTVTGKTFDPHGTFHRLTPEIREAAKQSANAKVADGEVATLSGIIREIDRDAHRFELRRIAASAIEEIRCIYATEYDSLAARALEEQFTVTVSGLLERSPDGRPRLLHVFDLKIPTDTGPKQTQLF